MIPKLRSNTAAFWGNITAVFGGRFDPPHLGHREAVRGLFSKPGVKQVLVIPSASPPHKPSLASAEDRSEMARLNFKALPNDSFPSEVHVDLREIERGRRNPTLPSYSYDTIQELRRIEPNLAFVIGADQALAFPTWYRFPEILGLCHWIILERQPNGAEALQKTFSEWASSGLIRQASPGQWHYQRSPNPSKPTSIALVPTDAPSISSTEIRETISRTGGPPENSLLPDIIGYLKAKRLYGI